MLIVKKKFYISIKFSLNVMRTVLDKLRNGNILARNGIISANIKFHSHDLESIYHTRGDNMMLDESI